MFESEKKFPAQGTQTHKPEKTGRPLKTNPYPFFSFFGDCFLKLFISQGD